MDPERQSRENPKSPLVQFQRKAAGGSISLAISQAGGWAAGQRTCGWTDGEISDSSEALGEVASSIQGDQLSRFAQDIHGLTWVSLG